MRFFKNLKKYPFMALLIISTVLLTIIAYTGGNTTYAGYSVNLVKNPGFLVVFEGIKDKNYPWKMATEKETEKELIQDNTEETDSSVMEDKLKDTVNPAGNTLAGSMDKTPDKTSKDKDSKDKDRGKKGNGKPDNTATTEKTHKTGDRNKKKPGKPDSMPAKKNKSSYRFIDVKESYFDDALFIGDSRTVGLKYYSGWKKPAFYADEGLTIYDIFDKKIAENGGKKLTIEEALKKQNFKKIYIMLGINEMGTGNTRIFIKAYNEVLNRLEKLQPDAIIFVEAIMNVTREKSDKDPIFNNKNIKDKNDHLALLADNKKIFYIDVNEAITDSTGGIPKKYTFDNIHLKAAYYNIWTDFLLKHGVR